MQQFKNKPGGFTELKKLMLLKGVPMMILALAAGLTISIVNNRNDGSFIDASFFLTIALSLGAGSYGFSIGIKREKVSYESYALTIAEDEIIREQTNTPLIKIKFSEVQEIIQNHDNSITVKSQTKTDIIGISRWIENREELVAALNNISPLVIKTEKEFWEKYTLLIIMLVLASMLGVFVADNKIIVGLSGVIFIAFMTRSIILTRQNKNITYKLKSTMYLSLLAFVSVVAVVIYKLFLR